MNWNLIADWAGIVFLVIGSLFTFVAAIGAFRYNDLLSRQHVATKPQVFSLIMLFTGVALMVRDNAMTWTLLIVIVFQLVTSPISAHIMARSGYRTGRVDKSEFIIDELAEDSRTGDDKALG